MTQATVEGGQYPAGFEAWQREVGGTPEQYVREWGGQVVPRRALAAVPPEPPEPYDGISDAERAEQLARQEPDGAAPSARSAAAAGAPCALVWSELWAVEQQERQWLLEPLVAVDEVVRVFSPPKTGKSLLLLEGAAALATGRSFLGRCHDPMHVLYLDHENTTFDLRDRLVAMGYGPDDDLGLLHYFLLQSWPPLDTQAGGQVLLDQVRQVRARLVIVDTQSKVVQGPENDNDTYAAMYRHTLLPLKREGVAVVLLDHAGKDVSKGARGGSAKAADVDVVWQMTTRTRGALTLRRTHSRALHDTDTLYLQRQADPLRHVVETVDQRLEDLVERCLEHFRIVAPGQGVSQTKAIEQLRAAGHSYRADTAREAYRRYVGEQGDTLV